MELKPLSAQNDGDIEDVEENDTEYLRQYTLASAMRDKKKKSLFSPRDFNPDKQIDQTSQNALNFAEWSEEKTRGELMDVKLRNIRRYLKATRALYDAQYHRRKSFATSKLRSHPYGFRTHSTFDTLISLLSPLRSKQIIDDWTALEIGIFEEAFERFGKHFHLIGQHLENKTVKDVVAFYYIWKKYGRQYDPRHEDIDMDSPKSPIYLKKPPTNTSTSSASSMIPSPSKRVPEIEESIDLLIQYEACMREFFDATRQLNGPRPSRQVFQKQPENMFGLKQYDCFESSFSAKSPLRTPKAMDHWSPYEIQVFEAAMDCFGKQFHRVTQVLEKKTCCEVMSFYYVWKKEDSYQAFKARLETKESTQQ